MPSASAPDLTNLPRFLDHLAERDPQAADFARLLLDDGAWRISGFWGPEQMDVWELDLQRGEWFVQFRIERGIAEGVRVARGSGARPPLDAFRAIGFATFAWARANAVPFRLDDPGDVQHDIVAHGRAALDWLADGHHPAFERVTDAALATWLERRTETGETLRTTQAKTVAAMEAAALE